MELISVEELHYSYVNKFQTVHALRGINCTFERGKFYAITGVSGSGKTTFLSLLAGLGSPTRGKIYVEGTDLEDMDKDEYRRKNVSVIYQSYNLFPLLTALENVMYPMQLNAVPLKEARRIAKENILKVGLNERNYKQFPQMMSGGEQQRIAIARAMSLDGRLLLADEPTGNLDSENAKNVLEMLNVLAHEMNRLVIVITHDPIISQAADVNYSMLDGRLDALIYLGLHPKT